MNSATQLLQPALDIDVRLAEMERSVDLLLNVTPVNAAGAWADFERSDFSAVPTLRLRPLEFEPDLVRRDLYNLQIENVDDPPLHTLLRTKRDEIARQITALEDRDTSRFVQGSLQLYGGISPSLVSAAEELLARDPAAIERFVAAVGRCVVKPLYGAKGRNVFMVEDETEQNLAQIIEAVLQDGYALAQEFVPGGEDGDARIFLLEGKLLEQGGKAAAFRRVSTGNDLRANISKGARSVPLEIGDVERGVIAAMSEKLIADGMFFVGIDVIGGKVVEINAESPGGLQSVEWLYEMDICDTVIEALERRVGLKPESSRHTEGHGDSRHSSARA